MPTPDEVAAALLATEAGTSTQRAPKLVNALKEAYAAEGLAIMLGDQPAGGTALDHRVARLQAIVKALDADEYVPTAFELGAMLKLTPSQASTVLRTYQARFPDALRERMKPRIAAVKPTTSGDKWEFQFDDVPTLEYAADVLRRRGVVKSLAVDRAGLTLTIDKKVKVGGADRKPDEILKDISK